MDVLEFLERIPNIKMNLSSFTKRRTTQPYQTLAYYEIYKGKDKGRQIVLFKDGCCFGVKSVNKEYTFDELEEAAKCFNREAMKHELKLVYRVYQAKLKGEEEVIQFCVSEVRETSFIEDVKQGHYLIDLDTLTFIKETEERNEARKMATEF